MMRRLLVVIDMQEGFRFPETMSVVPTIGRLAKKFGKSVTWLRFQNRKGSPFETMLHWKKMQDPVQQKLLAEFRKKEGKSFTHSGYSIFTPAFRAFLKKNKVRELILAGIYTDVCVKMAALEAFDAGVHVRVIENACASPHGKRNHAVAIDSLRHIIGKKSVIRASSFD